MRWRGIHMYAPRNRDKTSFIPVFIPAMTTPGALHHVRLERSLVSQPPRGRRTAELCLYISFHAVGHQCSSPSSYIPPGSLRPIPVVCKRMHISQSCSADSRTRSGRSARDTCWVVCCWVVLVWVVRCCVVCA